MGDVLEDDDAPRRRRRWPLVTVAVLLVVVLAGAWGRYRWFPRYRPELRDGESYGVDVSHHQGEIDWERVAGDDIEFAYIKATEGGDFVDVSFEANWRGAADAGLDRGAYHFFTLCRPGKDQAANFLATVPPDPDALPPVVDLELSGNCSDRPDRQQIEQELDVFLDEVETATDRQVVLYVGADFEQRYHLRDQLERPIWHRRMLRRPGVGGWWMWQFHAWAAVDGIDGDADLNVMRAGEPRPPGG